MSTAADHVSDRLTQIATARNLAVVVHEAAVEVPTDVVLPSGAGITVILAGSRDGETIAVSDGGAAVQHVRQLGLYLAEADLPAIKRAAKVLRLDFGAGELALKVQPNDVAWAISRVANGSRDIAEVAVRAVRRRQARNFKSIVRQQLSRLFPTAIITDRARIAGASARPYRFDYAVRLGGGRQLTLDLPHPDPTTVSTTVLRNLDVHRRNPPGLLQMIVWDDREVWPAESLSQLQLAEVALVRGSTLESALSELLGRPETSTPA
jgi:hypothetical protein